jgi:hypothetical protein
VPVFLGSKKEVEEATRYHLAHDAANARTEQMPA